MKNISFICPGKSYSLTDLSSLWVFKCRLKWPARDDAKSQLLHLFHFSPLRVFKCFLKFSSWEHAKLHWLHLFELSALCVFKCDLNWPAWDDAKSHWLHLSDFFLCAFSNASPKRLYVMMQSHIGYICSNFSPLCPFKCLPKLPFPLSHNACICLTVYYQVSPQIAYLRTCIVTLVTFIWFFSCVCSQMCPENASKW